MNEEREKLLQWHAAFFAGIQIELSEEADHLIFENEHMLGTKPMQIDVVIIRNDTKEKIRKNIGRIFRKFNIIEYKSPDDSLSIDDFYKVYGYACFYKSDTAKTNEIKITEITLSFVCSHYPRELLRHLETERGFRLEKQEEGIFYLSGDVFPIQFIVNRRLPQKENLWLRSLTNELDEGHAAQELLYEYKRHNREKLYQSVMDIIVRANAERFKEAKKMCDALLELMKDELDEQKQEGRQEGMQEHLLDQIRKKIRKGKSLLQIADELEETPEAILPLYNRLREN